MSQPPSSASPSGAPDEMDMAHSERRFHLSAVPTSLNTSLKTRPHLVLFGLILILGIFARVWEFGSLPPGLSQDEATNGADAYSVYKYGVDRNGVPYPIYFIAWGSGVEALYGYVLIPFIAVWGLSPVVLRVPLLIAGLIALPLMFHVGNRIGGRSFGLLTMFLLAISPWHILVSRWALEANFMPFLFLIAFACLLESTRDNKWFIAAGVFLALCLYTYGPAYAAVPIFLGCAVPILLITRRVRPSVLWTGLAVFSLVAFPIAVFIYINTVKLDSIAVGPITIPRLPGQPRFEGQAAFFSDDMIRALKLNARQLLSLLWYQTDKQPWNTVEPYGYFYRYTFPLVVVGGLMMIPLRRVREEPEKLLVLSWLGATMILGLLQPANTNRMNLMFMPLLIACAVCLDWLRRRFKVGFSLAVLALLVGFILFTRYYHSAQFREKLDGPFFTGLLGALEYARGISDNPICVTDEVRMPYIFVEFTEKMDPRVYLPTIVYDNPNAPFRQPRRLGRYRFGLNNCTNHSDGTVYVLDQTETIPHSELYSVRRFGNFLVYVP